MPKAVLALSALALAAAAASARAEPPALACEAPAALTAIQVLLPHTAKRIERHQKLTIVAVGSSSTQGVGASDPALSYPSRLEAELRERYPKEEIRVVNRGKGGQDVGEELQRLGSEVIAEHPDLVIWQVGTNAVLRRDDLVVDGDLLRQGIDLLRPSGADIVLMDLQYAPRVLDRPTYPEMERVIADAAKQERVGLFRRFEIMRHWQAARPDAPAAVGADGLHMNDRGYGCLAAQLAASLASNWQAQQRYVERRGPAAIAGLSAASNGTGPTAAH
jgi:lysophospholipase L1-like esterase